MNHEELELEYYVERGEDDEVKVFVKAHAHPEEAQTYYYPGSPAEMEICETVDADGKHVELTEIELENIELELWDKLHDKLMSDEIDRAEYLMEERKYRLSAE